MYQTRKQYGSDIGSERAPWLFLRLMFGTATPWTKMEMRFPCGSFWNTTLLKIANSVHGIEFHGVNFSLFHVYIFNMYIFVCILCFGWALKECSDVAWMCKTRVSISSELAAPHQFSKQVQATIAEVAHHGVITNSTDSKNVKWYKNGTGCV